MSQVQAKYVQRRVDVEGPYVVMHDCSPDDMGRIFDICHARDWDLEILRDQGVRGDMQIDATRNFL